MMVFLSNLRRVEQFFQISRRVLINKLHHIMINSNVVFLQIFSHEELCNGNGVILFECLIVNRDNIMFFFAFPFVVFVNFVTK